MWAGMLLPELSTHEIASVFRNNKYKTVSPEG